MADVTAAAAMKAQPKEETSRAFKWFHATSVNGGAMAIAATISSYYSIFVQENLGLTAASLSVIMLICSLWDAINDPLMGVLADNTRSKWGRYRIYFTFTPILLFFDAILLFTNPGLSSYGATFAYVLITYMLYGMIVTAYTMPQMAILPAATLNDQERNKIIAMGAGVCAVAFTVASTWTPQLVAVFGNYRNLMILYGVLAIISFWGLFKTGKEKYLQEVSRENPFKQLKYVFRHPQVYPVMIVWVLASVSYGFMFASSVYYAQYIWCAKRVDLTAGEDAIGAGIQGTISTYMGAVSFGALFSMVVFMPVFLKVFKTGYRALLVSQVLTVACYLVLFFFGRNNWIFCLVLSFIATLVGAMVNALVNVLVNDTIDFIMLKEGKQLNGIISSVKGFAQKCGNTVVNSGLLAILAIFGFNAQNGPFGQTAETVEAVNAVRFLVPALVSIAIIILIVFYPLKKYAPEIAAMKEKMAAEHAAKEAQE